MEKFSIFRELKAEFSKYANEAYQISEIKAQRASWKFGIFPSTSQIYEIHTCLREDDCSHGLQFHEYCLLVATIKSDVDRIEGKTRFKVAKSIKSDNTKPLWDVFLGGACNPTTWRFDVAIPFLKEKNITFYNPQVSKWDASLMELEERAKRTAKVQFFVLDIYRTRGIASLVEAAYLSGQGKNLVLVVPAERPTAVTEVDVNGIDETEFQSINRSYLFIADLVQRQGIPLFTSVADALKATRVSLITNSMVQDLTEIDGVIPVKHAYVNVSRFVRALQKTFSELDSLKSGRITISELRRGLYISFGRVVEPISQSKDTFTFPEFCIEFSILLLTSIIRHQESARSHSVDYFNKRPTSLENISNFQTMKSSVNIKNRIFPHEEEEEPDAKTSSIDDTQIKKKFFSCCWQRKNIISTCFTKLKKWPFSRISTISNELAEPQHSFVTVKLVPEPIFCEEKYDIFLGGTCGNSDWRERIAIPILQQAGCKFYDPKVSNSTWSRRLLPMEAQAREQSNILVYVITNECTSTAALVEAAHFIGQGKKILLFIDLLSTIYSPTHTPMLQSSCSFPSSSDKNALKSAFFPIHNAESSTTGYHSNTDTSDYGVLSSHSQFSSHFGNTLSISASGHLGSVEDCNDLSVSLNNISKMNPLSTVASNDHNRGRKYLIDLAKRAKVPILLTIEETIFQAVCWSQKPSPSHGWSHKSTS